MVEKLKNPKFKKSMITDELLEACTAQLEKYWGDRAMDDYCEICESVPLKPLIDNFSIFDCFKCPLGDGNSDANPCVEHETYIEFSDRLKSTAEQRRVRAEYLEKKLAANGIVFEEVENG